MPKVYNKYHKDAPTDAVYVGRPSKWGNPFSHLPNTRASHRVADRDAAVACYRKWAMGYSSYIASVKKELKGKDLVCWCAPKACHADVLLEIANDES